MDLAHPITAVTLPVTGRVLEVLAGTTKPLSASEVHRLVRDNSREGVRLALARLEEQGLVEADARPTAIYYTANRDHLAWPAIEQLVGLRTSLRNELARQIDGWTIQPIHASIFGSAARGDGDAKSDIDLLFVCRTDLDAAAAEKWEEQLDTLRDRVRRLTGNLAQTMSITPARLLEHVGAKDPIVASWRRESVLLRGTPISRLLSGPA